MIHADVDVAGGGELFDGKAQQCDAQRGIGQVGGVDPGLGAEHLGQVRVAVDRKAVGPRGERGVQRAREAFQGLPGQAVDQIHVHRFQAVFAAGAQDGERVFGRLLAVHRLLHLRIEILDAEAGAGDAQSRKLADVLGGDVARVEFDGDVAVFGLAEMEPLAQRLQQPGDLRGAKEVRRAAAEMQLHHLPVRIEQGGDAVDLRVQHLQIMRATTLVAGDDAVAAAVEAGALAERHVHVERQRARHRILVAARDRLAQLRLAEAFVEARRGRIGGVARAGAVVALQQGVVESGQGFHVAQCAGPLRGRA